MLSRDDYRARDALGLAGLVCSGEVTAGEILEAAIGEMERLNPALNAMVMRNDEKARDEAAAVDRLAPLVGVPFPAKDINVHVAGFPTRYACRFFADAPAESVDSLLVSRWRAAGLVVPARTNTPEFAADFGCEPELYDPTRNPWDLTRTPGGSSGAAAAAVASGMVPLAHATNSGGSIRVPAACCGIFGFKPSNGLVATGSALGSLVGRLNCDHALSWTVRDSAALLDATAGPEIGAPVPSTVPAGSFLAALEEPVGALRVGVAVLSPGGHAPAAEIAAKLEATAQMLAGLGHEVQPWDWPATDDAGDAAAAFWVSELAAKITERAEALGRSPRQGELGPLVAWSVAEATRIDSRRMVAARKAMRAVQVRMGRAFKEIDVLLTPVISEIPLKIGVLTDCVERSVEIWAERAYRFAPYTEIFNITGQPAMSVPLHQSAGGLPIGMQIAGKVGEDARLLRPWAANLMRQHSGSGVVRHSPGAGGLLQPKLHGLRSTRMNSSGNCPDVRSGVSRGRDAPPRARRHAPVPHPDPDPDRQVGDGRLRRGRRGRQHDPGVRGPDRGPRTPGWQAGLEARVPKGGSAAKTTAGKRAHLRRHRRAGLSITQGCRLMRIARSTHFHEPKDSADDTVLVEAMHAIKDEFGAFGWCRMQAALGDRGWIVNHKKIRRLMREHALHPLRRRRFAATTDSDHEKPVFPDRSRNCAIGDPNQLWVADLTCIAIPGGFAYLAAIIDVWARRIVGYALGRRIDAWPADANNLGWKLATVLSGAAGEALLESYNAERRPWKSTARPRKAPPS